MNILVTGAAGYIGSHTCVELLNLGHQIIALDNYANSRPTALSRVGELTGKRFPIIEADIRDGEALAKVFSQYAVDAVIHFAGLKAVGESTQLPLSYYDNNVSGSRALLAAMEKHNVNCLVFSSSATVYGDPDSVPITEDFPLRSTNPYGQTKLVVEQMCREVVNANSQLSVVLLRYFNPVGAHASGKIGEDPNGIPNNLMPFIAQVAVGKRSELSIFGGDYPTKDGTGVRDYIHVCDLAEGHAKALETLHGKPGAHIFNLGTGAGVSVLDMVKAYARVSQRPIPYQIVARRPGDVAQCYASPDHAKTVLGWQAVRSLDDMVASSWRWQSSNPHGYREA